MPAIMLPAARPARSAAGRPAAPATARPGPAVAEWPALGTLAALAVTDPAALPEARELLTADLAAVDAACSTFRGDSELAAVNATTRRDRPVRVSPLLAEAIAAALRAAEQTGGDVDPVTGQQASMAHGTFAFARAQRAGPPHGALALARAGRPRAATPVRLVVTAAASWRQVRLDQEDGLLELPPGSWLDLGGTAKAWAADRAAASIAARLGCGVLVGLGGDIAACGEPPPGGWRIRVQDKCGPAAGRPAGPAAGVSIGSGGLATAGASAIRWRYGGDVLARILRPRHGGPAAPAWRTVSVTAASCAEASAASTAAIIRGSQAMGWLSGHGLPSRLVDATGRVRTVAGWPAADDLAGTGRRTTAADRNGNNAGRMDAGGKAGSR
jgi:thiamine biosynthesis lipoprotein